MVLENFLIFIKLQFIKTVFYTKKQVNMIMFYTTITHRRPDPRHREEKPQNKTVTRHQEDR